MSDVLCRTVTADEDEPAVDPLEERIQRVAERERQIHNHPCPRGSGKTYVNCCIDRNNQESLELRHRRRMWQQGKEALV